MEQIPLNYEASDGDTNKQSTASLPSEVVQCLENARFLHLATCVDNVPHVSLMNYTYLPGPRPVIVMTTNPASKKTHNIVANPNVSLLVHDWVSHRPLTRRLSTDATSDDGGSGGSPSGGGAHPPPPEPSSLATLLLNLNTAAVSSISATINGTASVLPQGSPEEAYYRQQHLANNTFDADPVGPDERRIHQQIARAGTAHSNSNSNSNSSEPASANPDPRPEAGRNRFVAGEEVRVIVVSIHDIRISDWKGQVRDWVLEPSSAPLPDAPGGNAPRDPNPTVNGVVGGQ